MRIHRYIWALPNTLIGLPFVPVAILTGGRVQIVDGVLELNGGLIPLILRYCAPACGGASAMTLGHIVMGLDGRSLSDTRSHERAHVRQCEVWGPAFIPAYLAAGLWGIVRGRGAYEGNYFEREAMKQQELGQYTGDDSVNMPGAYGVFRSTSPKIESFKADQGRLS
jgi:hypothetical protein